VATVLSRESSTPFVFGLGHGLGLWMMGFLHFSRHSGCHSQVVSPRTVRKLLHVDNKSACIDDDVSYCNMFANFFVSKIDSLKSAIASQLIYIVPPTPDSVCSYYPSLQLLEPVNSLEVSKRLSTIPPKSCCFDYIPTAIIKQCLSVFSELIAYLSNLSFSGHVSPKV